MRTAPLNVFQESKDLTQDQKKEILDYKNSGGNLAVVDTGRDESFITKFQDKKIPPVFFTKIDRKEMFTFVETTEYGGKKPVYLVAPTSSNISRTLALKAARQMHQNSEEQKEQKAMYKKASDLEAAYLPHFRPPAWSLEMIKEDPAWIVFANEVIIYALRDETDKDYKRVRIVATERQPTNIGGPRYDTSGRPVYDFYPDELRMKFDYVNSGYTRLFEQDETKLPPNIALYTQTPISRADGWVAHVINAVGFGFDGVNQPDYKYFILGGRMELELHNRLRDVFMLVFRCAFRKGLPTVVLCMLGGGAFSELFPGGPERYVSQYFMPALKAALEQLQPDARPTKLGMMGRPDEGTMDMLRAASGGIECEAYGFVPAICEGAAAKRSLFMNAWDPHSVVGNGNKADDSLDGFFGRVSAMAYLSFPKINTHAKYEIFNLNDIWERETRRSGIHI